MIYLGDFLLPGALRTVNRLRRSGLRTLFVTNNATTTRMTLARKLAQMGLACRPHEVINAGHSAAQLLRRRHTKGTPVLVVGEKGLLLELSAAGMSPFRIGSRREYETFTARRRRTAAVVVSLDRNLSYWELAAALHALRLGAKLVACNLDSTWPVQKTVLPGTGSLVRMLEYASGVKAVLVGKPNPAMFSLILKEHGLRPSRTLVVGDRLDADVAAGRRLGAFTALVMTGVASSRDLAKAKNKPDFTLKSLKDLLRIPMISRRIRDGKP